MIHGSHHHTMLTFAGLSSYFQFQFSVGIVQTDRQTCRRRGIHSRYIHLYLTTCFGLYDQAYKTAARYVLHNIYYICVCVFLLCVQCTIEHLIIYQLQWWFCLIMGLLVYRYSITCCMRLRYQLNFVECTHVYVAYMETDKIVKPC